jgi:hypothetical protein
MSLLIRPLSIDRLKDIWVKVFLSRTDKVTKVSDGSVLSAVAFADSKIGQKALKDIALAQSRFYPFTTYGSYLDDTAAMFGIAPRFGALGSSTYIRVVGTAGTTYTAGVHTFKSSSGIVFDVDQTVVIGVEGFAHVPVSSQSTGSNTSIEPGLITTVTPVPVGHQYAVNEYAALNGRDVESDDQFRDRITSGINLLGRPTLEYLRQVMLKFNPNILRVFNYGMTANGKIKLGVATQDGSSLSSPELANLLSDITPWLSLSELNPDGLTGTINVDLVNISYQAVDLSFRCEFDLAYDPNKIRVNAQIRVNKYIDYRTWVSGATVQWDDLLQIVKATEGIRFVPDQYFVPGTDVATEYGKLPRIRGFLMLDMDGNTISGTSGGNLNPIFYPSPADFSFQASVLANL